MQPVITFRSLHVLSIPRKMAYYQNVVVFHRWQRNHGAWVTFVPGRACFKTPSLIKDSKTSIKAAQVVFSECAVSIMSVAARLHITILLNAVMQLCLIHATAHVMPYYRKI
jgi:hypothetical protein